MKTNSASMEALFDTLADVLKKTLTDGKTTLSKDGEIVQLTPDAATLNVVRQFLKDQNVGVVPGTSEVVNDLAKHLPFDGTEYDEDEARH